MKHECIAPRNVFIQEAYRRRFSLATKAVKSKKCYNRQADKKLSRVSL